MSQYKNRLHRRNSNKIAITKPNTLSLLRQIARATVLDGMQWPVIFSIVLAFALYNFDVTHHESLTILIVTFVIVSGLIRGCNAWQGDLVDYQRQLAIARHEQLDDAKPTIPGYFPSRRY
ncbi:MAG TPA: hypothetical protein VM011_14765 [Gammaproteobacteria bacterium]|nr:hypothetical protein [Gammaproteobacteria bacterium]